MKLLFLVLCLFFSRLQASHLQTFTTISPSPEQNSNGEKEYLIQVEIRKTVDATNGISEVIASPKIVCLEGKTAQVTLESEDKASCISVQVNLLENTSPQQVETSIFMKENNEVVLDTSNRVEVNGF